MVFVLDRRVHPVTGVLLVLTLIVSLLAALDHELYWHLALVPDRVRNGELWRLVTWVLVRPGAMALISGGVVLYWFGGDLEAAWGSQRFWQRVAALVLAIAAGMLLLASVLPATSAIPYLGGSALGSALIIAWALEFPEERLRVYLVLVLGGRTLAYGMALVSVLLAVFYGVVVVPNLLACAAALLHAPDTRNLLRQALRRLRARRQGPPDNRPPRGPFN